MWNTLYSVWEMHQPSGLSDAVPCASASAAKAIGVILLVSGATTYPRSSKVGHLIVPRQWNKPESLPLTPGQWAMDNGAFSGFDPGAFVRMLEAYHGRAGCLFVTAPDVVGDAAATFALWPFWSRLIRGLGHIPAWVAQDGMRPELVPNCGAIFIGGSTAFKESEQVRSLCTYAKARGHWVHWGRVNGKRRYELALKAGVDSIDGTGFSMFPNTNIAKVAEWESEIAAQPELLDLGGGPGK